MVSRVPFCAKQYGGAAVMYLHKGYNVLAAFGLCLCLLQVSQDKPAMQYSACHSQVVVSNICMHSYIYMHSYMLIHALIHLA